MFISRQQVANEKTTLFIYSDDRTRKAYMGQASAGAGFTNSFPITTKLWNCRDSRAFFSDDLYDEYSSLMANDISRIKSALPDYAKVSIFPHIGRGCSELHIRAPRLYTYLLEQLRTIDPTYEG